MNRNHRYGREHVPDPRRCSWCNQITMSENGYCSSYCENQAKAPDEEPEEQPGEGDPSAPF